jgi:hypothetical protein
MAASPSDAALELEQQDCVLELGEGQGTSLEQEVGGPATAPTHDLKQAQSVFVQHPKVGRAVVDVVGLVALPLSPRWRRAVQCPKVGRAVVDVADEVEVALLLSPSLRRGVVAIQGVRIASRSIPGCHLA